ncbi:hypothetical protein AJ80_08473 [Polytolypa hystricis UAMH7299]|uniref:Uncharacterized protein n=1 Tax=Polytolypa hystricis (strain UAMH7299) TaxID=1447883 RepID=A0A2B7X7I7_POLH7|nr:hypothetical protein AJ80_08473 [Polytolypa hystricis UAMH7299]
MPIKLPKGFTRRKSSGNALEDIQNQPERSFKVFERPHGGSKSFDGASALRLMGDDLGKTSSEDPDPDNIFAGLDRPSSSKNRHSHDKQLLGGRTTKLTGSSGSRGTNNSASTGGLYDSSSSTKFSSSSTLPSSADIPLHDIPVPPIPDSPFSFSLRAGGRTFSFGSKGPKPMAPGHNTPPGKGLASRDRAMTSSTTSTATPPRLLDSDLNLGESGGFGDIFEGIDKKKDRLQDLESSVSNPGSPSPYAPPPVPSKDASKPKSSFLSALRIDNSKDVEPSPYSNDSQTSRDGLIGKSAAMHEERARPRDAGTSLKTVSPKSSGNTAKNSANPMNRLQRNSQLLRPRNSAPIDEDAQLVMDSVATNRRSVVKGNREPEASSLFASEKDEPLFGDVHSQQQVSPTNARKPLLGRPGGESQADMSFSAQADLVARFEESMSKSEVQPNKVMTPAQFERYREQQERTRIQNNMSSSQLSDDDSDSYDDEDEAEKNRETAKQRKKQEAHLSVYRQQMMKVTGEQSRLPDLESNRLSSERGNNLSAVNRASTFGPDRTSGEKLSDGEDDDDVPLGILAAHGFPNRNRPPSRLLPSMSNPNLRASVQQFTPAPPSLAGGEQTPQANRGSLPVFARNLPKDPYFGASLVNPTHRESLALGGGSVYGGVGGGGGGPAAGLPPGGLVGVIANEERAKAMRRGSPNPRGGFDVSGGIPGLNAGSDAFIAHQSMNPGTAPFGMGGMQGPPAHTATMPAGDQTQMQMSQQMTQMMQTQIQWMQSMMQLQGIQAGQPMPPNSSVSSLLAPPGPDQRPMSMLSNLTFGNPLGPPQVDQRTLSLLDPSMSSQWNPHRQSSFIPPSAGYAPSVAPSERSNVGTASRYRPVSTIQPDLIKPSARSSTFTASTMRPWSNEPRQNSLTGIPNAPGTHPSIRPISGLRSNTLVDLARSRGPVQGAGDDEEDDEGWAEMMKNREKKKSSWKFKRGKSGLGDIFHHTAV